MPLRSRENESSAIARWALGALLGSFACAVDSRDLDVAPSSSTGSAEAMDTATVEGPDDGSAGAGPASPRTPSEAVGSGDGVSPSMGSDDESAPAGSGPETAGAGADPAGGAAGASNTGGAGGGPGDGSSAGASGTGEMPPLPPDPPDQCPGVPEPCGDQCVDLQSDVEHCGACDSACASNESCSGGSCVCSGELFPCVSFEQSVSASDYGVLNVAGYRDATHDWVAFSDSTGNAGSTIIIQDNTTQLPIRSIEVPQWEVQLAFLPNEPTLLYSSNGTLSRVTEQDQPTELMRGVPWFRLSPDGRALATLDSTNAMVLTLRSYPSLAVQDELALGIPMGNQYERLAFSRDGRWLAVSGLYENIQVQLFDLSNGTTRLLRATGATGTYSPVFSEDGTELFVGGGYADGRVYVFDTATGAELRRLNVLPNYVYSVEQVPGFRQLLVGGYDGRLAIIDAVTGAELWSDDVGHVNRSIFAPDGSRIFTGTGAGSGSLVVHTVF